MGAEDVGCGLLECGEVEGPGAVPYVGGEHGGADRGGGDAVLVGLAKGAVAGVEVFGGLLDGEYADAGWEGSVEGFVEIGCWDGGCEREGGDLGEGVDTCVGAA